MITTKLLLFPVVVLTTLFISCSHETCHVEHKKDAHGYSYTDVTNDLFTLEYILDMGKNNNIKLPLAVKYMSYLGTDKYSAEDFQKELYRLGINLSVYASEDRTYVSLSGLQKSLEPGVKLLEHLINHIVPDSAAYKNHVRDILKKRSDMKKSKSAILWEGLFNYGKYGKDSPFTRILPETALKQTDPKELTNLIEKIETEHITKTNIYHTYLNDKDRGVNYHVRKDVYNGVKTVTLDNLNKFFDKHIKGKNYTFLILGNKKTLDMPVIRRLGDFRELTLKEIFNY